MNPDGRRNQRSAAPVWGLLFLVIAALAVLTSNRLVDRHTVQLGLPVALIVIGLLGLLLSSGFGSGGRIKGTAGPGTPREHTRQGEEADGQQETHPES